MDLVIQAAGETVKQHLVDALPGVARPTATFRKLAAQHEAILVAIESGDTVRATALVEEHILAFYRMAAP